MTTVLTSTGVQFGPSGTTMTTQAPVDRGGPISIVSFTSSGTYTVPANCKTILVQVQGGGGGSAGYCEAGGAGGFAEGVFTVSPGASYSVTVGGGGGGVGYYAAAGDGGTTSFGALISASGGYGANRNYSHGGGHGGNSFGGAQLSVVGGSGTGHANSGSHSQAGDGGAGFFGGSGGQYRSTTASNFGPSPGSGASGGRGNDGGSGTSAPGGLCIVFAYY